MKLEKTVQEAMNGLFRLRKTSNRMKFSVTGSGYRKVEERDQGLLRNKRGWEERSSK